MTAILQQVSNALATAVETIGVGIVRVEARRRLPATGVVWSSDGIIVTAHHVVTRQDTMQVGLADGQTVPATLVGRDPTTDVAVLRVELTGFAVPTWTELDSEALRVGHLVLAMGRPGQAVQATLGIIRALGDSWRPPAGGRIDRYVETDVVMYPGFSGGPLVDAAGHIIGMNTSAILRNVSLAVPVRTLKRVVEMLLAHGRVRRGFLGVSTQVVRLPVALAESLQQETGLLLTAIEPESPAEQSQLLLGDTLVLLDRQPMCQHDDLLTLLGSERMGTTVSARLIRGGEVVDRQVAIGEHD